MRTALRDEFVEAGLRGTDIERRVTQVIDAANDDIAASLRQAGRPEAARAFAVADRYWRNRIDTIDNTLAPIIGKNGDASGEQVVKKLQAAMAGNNQRFVSFVNTLPPEEQATVRASLIGRMGRATKGNQNDQGDAFSLSTFLSNWDDIGETAKTRLFGPEGRAALNDLATVAGGARNTAKYANHSNTSGGIWGNLGVAGGVAVASPLAAITGVAGQYITGHTLASPRFARWLARSATTRVPAANYIERLTRVATAEPAIANNVFALQTRLTEALGSGAPARLAAEETGDEALVGNRGQGNQQTPLEGTQP